MDIREEEEPAVDLDWPDGVPPGGIRYLRQQGLDFDEIWRVLAFAGRAGLQPEEALRSRGWRRDCRHVR